MWGKETLWQRLGDSFAGLGDDSVCFAGIMAALRPIPQWNRDFNFLLVEGALKIMLTVPLKKWDWRGEIYIFTLIRTSPGCVSSFLDASLVSLGDGLIFFL